MVLTALEKDNAGKRKKNIRVGGREGEGCVVTLNKVLRKSFVRK